MSGGREFELLTELSKLLKRYGPEVFELLAGRLADPQFTETISKVLASTAKVARAVQKPRDSSKKVISEDDEMTSKLLTLTEEDRDRGETLQRIYKDLKEKRILPSRKAVVTFVETQKLPLITSRDREKAVIVLMRCLCEMSYDKLREIASSLTRTSTKSDRSLDRWSEVILSRHQKDV